MKLVLEDVVRMVNERRAQGDFGSWAYSGRWGAARLGLDPRAVRDVLTRLVDAGVLVIVGQVPGRRGLDPTPLYALAVEVACPLGACVAEAGAVVVLDDELPAATCDAQAVAEPAVELVDQPGVLVAELEDVAHSWLAAPVGGADGLVGPTVRGHAAEQYVAEATECPLWVPAGPNSQR